MLSRFSPLARNFSTSLLKRSSHGPDGGIPGVNLPFDIHNKYKLTLYFVLFFGSGIAGPFLIIRHNMLK